MGQSESGGFFTVRLREGEFNSITEKLLRGEHFTRVSFSKLVLEELKENGAA